MMILIVIAPIAVGVLVALSMNKSPIGLKARAGRFLTRSVPKGMKYAPDSVSEMIIRQYSIDGSAKNIKQNYELMELLDICITEGDININSALGEEKKYFQESVDILRAIRAEADPSKTAIPQRAKKILVNLSFRGWFWLIMKSIPLISAMCIGIWLYGLAQHLDRNRIEFENQSIQVPALIISKNISKEYPPKPRKNRLDAEWMLSIQYKTVEGKTVGPLSTECPDDICANLATGDSIQIRYHPTLPARLRIVGDERPQKIFAKLKRLSINIFCLSLLGFLVLAAYICRKDDKSVILQILKRIFQKRPMGSRNS